MPKAVWVRSLVPKEKNSAVSAVSAARNDARGRNTAGADSAATSIQNSGAGQGLVGVLRQVVER
jgi:hypothetical protein